MSTDSYQEWNEQGWLDSIPKEDICELIYTCAEQAYNIAQDLKILHNILQDLCINEENLREEAGWEDLDRVRMISGEILYEINDRILSSNFADNASSGAIEELKERGLDPALEMAQHLKKKGYEI